MQLAADLSAELTVLYIADMDDPHGPENDDSDNAATESRLLDSLRSQLEEYAQKVAIAEVVFSVDVRYGSATEQINLAAAENQIDLIVIGTHGRSGLDHLLMGSIAESVLRASNVPVMCIRR